MKRFLRPRYLLGVPAVLCALLVAIGLIAGPPPAPVNAVAAIPPAAPTVSAPPAPAALTVAHVADGDTVGLSDGRKIRLLGIDTPESVKPNAPVDCYGLEASAFAKATLLGQPVTVTADPTQDATDRYGRSLAYLGLADGRDYSVMAAEAGMARSYVYAGKPVAKHPQIVAAEQAARAAGRGLWGACPQAGPSTPPTTSVAASGAGSASRTATRTPAPTVDAPRPAGSVFTSCAAARTAGAAPLHRGGPGYSSRLDRDGDGVACE